MGGGVIAQRRIQTLLRFGCQITMITPECTDILRQHAEQKRITACFRTYQADDCAFLISSWPLPATTLSMKRL